MKCGAVQEQLSGYLDGALARRLAAKVDAHLKICNSCLRALEELESLKCRLRNTSTPTARPGFWAGVYAEIGGREPECARSFRDLLRLPQVRIPALAAGAVTVAFIIAWLSAALWTSRSRQPLSPPVFSDLARYSVVQPLNDAGVSNFIHVQSNVSSLDGTVIFADDTE